MDGELEREIRRVTQAAIDDLYDLLDGTDLPVPEVVSWRDTQWTDAFLMQQVAEILPNFDDLVQVITLVGQLRALASLLRCFAGNVVEDFGVLRPDVDAQAAVRWDKRFEWTGEAMGDLGQTLKRRRVRKLRLVE